MPMPEPNVKIHIGKSGRARVLVDGKPMVGVIGVELIQPHAERQGPDGWVRAEKEGAPIWHIKVLSRFVNASPAKDEVDGGRG